MLNITYLRELCEKAPEMFCDYCGKFVGHAAWCRAPKSTEVLKAALDRIEALEWLLEVKEVTWADMDEMSIEGFREFQEIRKKALRDAGMEVRHA